jgi:integrase
MNRGTWCGTSKRCSSAPIYRISGFHDLRHGCATVLISQGVHPRIVMEIMGHSQISVTMNTYGHVLPETQREAARLLDQLYTEPEKE